MRKPLLIFAVCCAILLALPSTQAPAQTASVNADARVIVKYKADSKLLRKDLSTAAAQHAAQAEALGQRVGLTLRTGEGVAQRTQVVFATGMTSQQLAQRLGAESDIEYAVPDERRHHMAAPNDPLYLAGPPVTASTGGPVVGQWYLRAPAGEVQASINVEPAWDLSVGGATVVVAMIDTGARFDHPDLQRVAAGGNLLPGYDMISDAVSANDGDGRDADASDPGDWLTQAEVSQRGGEFNGCTAENSSWHGTQTSGLVGALTNNGIGMASVGRNVRLLPVRVLGKCGGHDSDILAGMLWAAGISVPGVPANPNPARVLNMSLGGDGACSSAYVDAVTQINAVGAVVVAAAGNGTGHAVGTPANCPGVIAVAGLRHFGTKVGFSDLGPQVALSAPGGNCVNTAAGTPCLYPILTTANAGTTVPIADAAGGSIYTDSFDTSLGTSFSAPLVAGTVALMLSVQPALTPAQVLAQLQATARPFPTTGSFNTDGTPVPQCVAPQPIGSAQIDQNECFCTTTTCGAGMLDAGAAVLAALGGVAPAAPGTLTATEFYHPQFNHYFITADPAETASLTAGNLPPWVPTGMTFKVWDGAGTNITNVCRFFSASFAPESSHFYSNTPTECPGLQAGGVWVLENLNAFYMMPSPTGTCPSGSSPLYRQYNNGQGGAPNHRYTIDAAVRSSMIAAGWIPEGNGADGVFACVPA